MSDTFLENVNVYFKACCWNVYESYW